MKNHWNRIVFQRTIINMHVNRINFMNIHTEILHKTPLVYCLCIVLRDIYFYAELFCRYFVQILQDCKRGCLF